MAKLNIYEISRVSGLASMCGLPVETAEAIHKAKVKTTLAGDRATYKKFRQAPPPNVTKAWETYVRRNMIAEFAKLYDEI